MQCFGTIFWYATWQTTHRELSGAVVACTIDRMRDTDHEQGLLVFMRKERVDRYAKLLSTPCGRKKFIQSLPHFSDWDPRAIELVSSGAPTQDEVRTRLLALRAPPECYVISSSSPKLDAQRLPLDDALDSVFGWLGGAVISCIPGRLAYYEGEDMNVRYVLFNGDDRT